MVASTQIGVGPAGFAAPMVIYFFGCGLVQPSAYALAMEPVPRLAGTASAVTGSLQMLSGAISGYITTRVGGSSPTTFALVVIATGAVSWLLSLPTAQRKAAEPRPS
jgi:DHA1 family bicyclomycin/chloramphenicol resistance-like MFS transporter